MLWFLHLRHYHLFIPYPYYIGILIIIFLVIVEFVLGVDHLVGFLLADPDVWVRVVFYPVLVGEEITWKVE